MYNNCGFNLCGKNNDSLWIILIIVAIWVLCFNDNGNNNDCCC